MRSQSGQMHSIVPEGRVENSPGWSEAESWEDAFGESVRPGGAARTSFMTSIAFMRLPCGRIGAEGLRVPIHEQGRAVRGKVTKRL